MNCERCGLSLLKRNYKEHLDKQVCSKVREINGQLRIVHPGQPPKDPIACPHCRQVVSKLRLRKHIRKYHPDQAKTPRSPTAIILKCTVCQKELNRKSFRGHFVKRHPELTYYPERGVRVENGKPAKRSSKKNRESASNIPKQPMTCPYCSTTVSKFGFSKHVKKYHSEHPDSGAPSSLAAGDKVICSVCSEQVSSKLIKVHFTKSHPDVEYDPSSAIKPESSMQAGESMSELGYEFTETSLLEGDDEYGSEEEEDEEDEDEEEEESSVSDEDAEGEGIIDSDLDEHAEDSEVLIKTLKDKRRRISAFRSSLNTSTGPSS